jgi:hypothetical protein
MGKNKPFVFGIKSVNTPLPNEKKRKPKKIKPTEIQMDNASDAFYCKDRIKDKPFLCRNEKCVCKYKKYNLDDIYLEINKSIIINYFSGKKKDKYATTILNTEWKSSKLRNKFGHMVYEFIKQCKFVYGLDLIVKRKKLEKVNTATEAKNCKDRIPATNCYCKGCIINENGEEKKYRCLHSYNTENGIDREYVREWFVRKLKSINISKWDKIILTFNWSLLSTKQEVMVKKFMIKYHKFLPKLNTQIIP